PVMTDFSHLLFDEKMLKNIAILFDDKAKIYHSANPDFLYKINMDINKKDTMWAYSSDGYLKELQNEKGQIFRLGDYGKFNKILGIR
ncbi:MAG: hypothetical protein ACK5LP_07545, partial [Campylobacteraceae bacterium]